MMDLTKANSNLAEPVLAGVGFRSRGVVVDPHVPLLFVWGETFYEGFYNYLIASLNYFTEMCSGSEAGSYVRFIDLCITQL